VLLANVGDSDEKDSDGDGEKGSDEDDEDEDDEDSERDKEEGEAFPVCPLLKDLLEAQRERIRWFHGQDDAAKAKAKADLDAAEKTKAEQTYAEQEVLLAKAREEVRAVACVLGAEQSPLPRAGGGWVQWRVGFWWGETKGWEAGKLRGQGAWLACTGVPETSPAPSAAPKSGG
jgi:hypothetical protein